MENEITSFITSAITSASIVATAIFTVLKKWFLDVETYKADKEKEDAERAEESKERAEAESRIFQKFEDTLEEIKKEKADMVDLDKAERKIEKLEAQIASMTATVEKQCYRIDLYISSTEHLSKKMDRICDDVQDLAKTTDKRLVSLQLDVQELKTKLESMQHE